MLYLGLLKRCRRLTLLAQATVLLRRSGLDARLEIVGVDDVPELEAAAARLGLLPLGLVAAMPGRVIRQDSVPAQPPSG